jgi:thiamine pyrophosphokinase
MGYKYFEIYGCIGGRLDHTIANLQTASFVAENNGLAVFFDVNNKSALAVIKNNSIAFSSDCSGNISVFSVCDISTGVNEKGLFYELENGVLTNEFPLGVSNEFIKKDAYVSVENGKLCIIWDNLTGSFEFGGNYD